MNECCRKYRLGEIVHLENFRGDHVIITTYCPECGNKLLSNPRCARCRDIELEHDVRRDEFWCPSCGDIYHRRGGLFWCVGKYHDLVWLKDRLRV